MTRDRIIPLTIVALVVVWILLFEDLEFLKKDNGVGISTRTNGTRGSRSSAFGHPSNTSNYGTNATNRTIVLLSTNNESDQVEPSNPPSSSPSTSTMPCKSEDNDPLLLLDMFKNNGSWVSLNITNTTLRYQEYLSMDEEEDNQHYLFGDDLIENLSSSAKSNLTIGFWGDSTMRQLTSSVVCWLAKRVPWNSAGSTFPLNEIEHSQNVSFVGRGCFGNQGEAQSQQCLKPYFRELKLNVTGFADRLDQCRFQKIHYQWKGSNNINVGFQWIGLIKELEPLLNETRAEDLPDIIFLNTGLHWHQVDRPGPRVFYDELSAFFNHITNSSIWKSRVVWIETNPNPPSSDHPAEPSVVARRAKSVDLALSYGIPVIRTFHLIRSSNQWKSRNSDVHYPPLNEHRAQRVISFLLQWLQQRRRKPC